MSNIFADRPLIDTRVSYPPVVLTDEIVNTHTHPRDTDEEKDGRAELHIPLLAEVIDIALCMGNTKPPLTDRHLAFDKGRQWRKLVPQGSRLELRVGGLITEKTHPNDVVRGYDMPEGKACWDYMKMFIRAASNAHGADVDDVSKIIPVIKAMTYTKFKHRKHPMTTAIHMERKFDVFGRRILFLQREPTSVERDLSHILREVPDAKLVVCHVTCAYTIEVIRYLRSKGFNVWGEIAPHYDVFNCDDLFEAPDGGTMMNCNIFCIPIFKTEADRQAIHQAMLSGEDCWIFGCDEACWPDDPTKPIGVKINDRGYVIGGQTQIPKANVSYVIEKFVEAGKNGCISKFLSRNAREAYGLPSSQSMRKFNRRDWSVRETLERQAPHGLIRARVALGGTDRKYVPEEHAA